MNKRVARELAETITNEQLQQMFDNAKANIKDWTKRSVVNKGMTIGVGWNILVKDFDINQTYHKMGKTNMIREFGNFLDISLKPMKSKSKVSKLPMHIDPEF